MKFIKITAIIVILCIIGGWIAFKSLTIYVPIGMVGVRTQEYAIFGEKGVAQLDYKPGWHWDRGPIDTWILFDSTVQTLEMTRETRQGSIQGRDDVQVQSADGYAVSVDVTVKYRIMLGQAHKVFKDTGSGVKYKTIVRNGSQEACMSLFGKMKTEDFYNPEKRRENTAEAKERLKTSLSNNFVEVIDVLIRNVQFDPEYENKIRTKKLADQEVELNISMARAARKKGKTEVIEAGTRKIVEIIKREKEAELIRMEAETDRKVSRIKANYEKYSTKKKADADWIAAQNDAKGILLVKKAEAEGERLRNQAMQGVGGSTIVALEAARNLNLADILISTVDIDLLNLEEMATRLGVPKKDREEGDGK